MSTLSIFNFQIASYFQQGHYYYVQYFISRRTKLITAVDFAAQLFAARPPPPCLCCPQQRTSYVPLRKMCITLISGLVGITSATLCGSGHQQHPNLYMNITLRESRSVANAEWNCPSCWRALVERDGFRRCVTSTRRHNSRTTRCGNR